MAIYLIAPNGLVFPFVSVGEKVSERLHSVDVSNDYERAPAWNLDRRPEQHRLSFPDDENDLVSLNTGTQIELSSDVDDLQYNKMYACNTLCHNSGSYVRTNLDSTAPNAKMAAMVL